MNDMCALSFKIMNYDESLAERAVFNHLIIIRIRLCSMARLPHDCDMYNKRFFLRWVNKLRRQMYISRLTFRGEIVVVNWTGSYLREIGKRRRGRCSSNDYLVFFFFLSVLQEIHY